MASPRITQTMRSRIVKDTIDSQFKSERESLKKREHALADATYNEEYSVKQREAMKELGDKFVETSMGIHVNANGKVAILAFPEPTPRYVRKNASWSRYAPKPPLTTKIEAFLEDEADFRSRSSKAEIALMAMLESVQSFKKLRAVWPQGVKFYDMYDVDSETKAGVPAVVVTELNKLLGIK